MQASLYMDFDVCIYKDALTNSIFYASLNLNNNKNNKSSNKCSSVGSILQ